MATVLPGCDLAVEHAALEAGRQDVAEHHQRLLVRAVGNRIEAGVGVGNADELRLRAVDRVAEDPAAGRAMGIHLLAAIFALAAGGDAGDQHVVAGLEGRDGRPDRLDDADALVAEDAARLAGGHVALEDVQVGAADRRLGDLDDRVGGRRDFRLRMVLQGFLARALIDKGFHQAGRCGAARWFRHRLETHCLPSFR